MDDLEATLRARLGGSSPEVPGEIDDAILRMARRRLRRRRWVPLVAAAAAACVLLGLPMWSSPEQRGGGGLDVVDAYLLATRLQQGAVVGDRWDLNRDGRVDGADVDRIVGLAVALERGQG